MAKKAEADVDGLTYNRIRQIGFGNLTDYQQNTIKWAVCEHANFLFENDDMLTSALTSYSINGVSMGFDSAAVVRINGATVSNRVYSLLLSTNLMYGGLR